MQKKGYEKPVIKSEKIKIGVFGKYINVPVDLPPNSHVPTWFAGNCTRR